MTTRGLHVEGVDNDGSNVQYYDANHSVQDESLLAFAGVGASTLNKTTTAKMGDFRERLLWSRAPVVGSGSNGSAGVSATTGPDGAPRWSVDDDAMPMSFFDMQTGEFIDSVQTRVSSRVMVNFGNPFKDKRGDAIVPENFLSQSPSFQRGRDDASSSDGPHTPPGSPPHDAFTSSDGEDEAVFAAAERPNRRKSPHHVPAAMAHDQVEELTSHDKRPREFESKADDADNPVSGESAETVSRKKPRVMPGPPPPKQSPQAQGNAPRPPPPPPKPPAQKKVPPPPPPKAPPRPSAEKHPATRPLAPATSKQKPQDTPPVPTATSEHPATTTGESTQEQVLDLQSPDKKPQVNLPPGWMCVWSKSQKRWYFFDTKSNNSVWEWPPPGGMHR